MPCEGNTPPFILLAAAAAAIALAGSEVVPPPSVTGHKVNIPLDDDAADEPGSCWPGWSGRRLC